MAKFVESEYEINEKDTNITLSDVNADVQGIAIEFKTPRKTAIIIRPSDTISLYFKDNGTTPTELPAANNVKLRHTDPNEVVRYDLIPAAYEVFKEFRDRDTIRKVGVVRKLSEDQKLQILVKPENLSSGATKLDKTATRLRLTCLRIAEMIQL